MPLGATWYEIFRRIMRMPPAFSGGFVGAEMESAEIELESDPIIRYDVDDAVDVEHYPDGRYWRFNDPTKAARLFVVKDGKIQSIADVYRTQDGDFWWAERRSAKL
jgi:hypothetical protein